MYSILIIDKETKEVIKSKDVDILMHILTDINEWRLTDSNELRIVKKTKKNSSSRN